MELGYSRVPQDDEEVGNTRLAGERVRSAPSPVSDGPGSSAGNSSSGSFAVAEAGLVAAGSLLAATSTGFSGIAPSPSGSGGPLNMRAIVPSIS
jgi:hypothetical protein